LARFIQVNKLMAFDIDKWKSVHTAGFLRSSNYIALIYPPQWAYAESEKWWGPDLAYLISATSLPGVQIATTESRLYGQGPLVKMPYDILITDIQMKLYVDATGRSIPFFHDWVRNIVNLSHVQNEPRFGAFSNQISYRSEYATRIDILVYGDKPRVSSGELADGALMIYSLYDAFPVSVSEASLDWQAGGEIMTFNVSWAYRSFEYKLLEDVAPTIKSTAVRIQQPKSTSASDAGTAPTRVPLNVSNPTVPTAVPVDLSNGPPQVNTTAKRPESGLARINKTASNIRESSQKVRTQSVSLIKNVESVIYNNEYIKAAENIVGTINDVRKTVGVLAKLNNTLKSDLKQQLTTATGGKSLKNIIKF